MNRNKILLHAWHNKIQHLSHDNCEMSTLISDKAKWRRLWLHARRSKQSTHRQISGERFPCWGACVTFCVGDLEKTAIGHKVTEPVLTRAWLADSGVYNWVWSWTLLDSGSFQHITWVSSPAPGGPKSAYWINPCSQFTFKPITQQRN